MALDRGETEKEPWVARRESRLLIERLEARMEELGTNAAEVSRKAALGNTAVYDIITSKNKNPSVPVLQAIAKVLQTHLAYLAGDSDDADGAPEHRGVQAIPVLGIAETGTFRKMPATDRRTARKVYGPPSEPHPNATRFAIEVRDDAMSGASITPGMHALCVDMESAGLTIESRCIYACRRTLDGGKTFETLIRRAMVYADRVELLAESPTSYDKIVFKRDRNGDLPTAINAIGLVYAAMVTFDR